MKGWVDRTAHVPGETITFNGSAEILGGGKFRKSSLKLYQVNSSSYVPLNALTTIPNPQIYTLHCEKLKHDISFKLFEQKREGPIEFDQWNRILMTIPPVPPTTENGFIDVPYCISVCWIQSQVTNVICGNLNGLGGWTPYPTGSNGIWDKHETQWNCYAHERPISISLLFSLTRIRG